MPIAPTEGSKTFGVVNGMYIASRTQDKKWKCVVCEKIGERKLKNKAGRREREGSEDESDSSSNSGADDDAKPQQDGAQPSVATEALVDESRFGYTVVADRSISAHAKKMSNHLKAKHGITDGSTKMISDWKKEYASASASASALTTETRLETLLKTPTRTQGILDIFAKHHYPFRDIESLEWKFILHQLNLAADFPNRKAIKAKMFSQVATLEKKYFESLRGQTVHLCIDGGTKYNRYLMELDNLYKEKQIVPDEDENRGKDDDQDDEGEELRADAAADDNKK